ncbi:hypothetical protein SBI_06650 [Streptomyces bingchenggensis BCW-1]|uniref:Uncharacterized protein n=1 Tax=Streptomyces bingchenggensis (strain BCW-1) TaxID=749414 RepID=D7BXM2_STRBB|nr:MULTISPECIES: hypothetical protein [Streptomyces]ADI09770.1 hypothetical protein SBI_06650 [Streptomyces bingchenggensis BCW-1]
MYGDDIHLRLHRIRAERLHLEALRARARHRPRPPRQPRRPRRLRSRLGWTLVEVGLRLATPRPRPGQQPGLAARL